MNSSLSGDFTGYLAHASEATLFTETHLLVCCPRTPARVPHKPLPERITLLFARFNHVPVLPFETLYVHLLLRHVL